MSFGTLTRFEAAGAVPARGFTSMAQLHSDRKLSPCKTQWTFCKPYDATSTLQTVDTAIEGGGVGALTAPFLSPADRISAQQIRRKSQPGHAPVLHNFPFCRQGLGMNHGFPERTYAYGFPNRERRPTRATALKWMV